MTKPFPLQAVLELMRDRADEATRSLARLIANERDAKSRLTLLLGYRDEYVDRFRQAAQNGLTQLEWSNFQH
ncbi:MAG: flagellar export protein FliJ, partial [Candidatus Accumulibacter sp.]|nr:flagellar export protein FliJ [Accumulibacter sp.]